MNQFLKRFYSRFILTTIQICEADIVFGQMDAPVFGEKMDEPIVLIDGLGVFFFRKEFLGILKLFIGIDGECLPGHAGWGRNQTHSDKKQSNKR